MMADRALLMGMCGLGIALLGVLPTACSNSTVSSVPTPATTTPSPANPSPSAEPSASPQPTSTASSTPSPSPGGASSPGTEPSPNLLTKIQKDLSNKVAIAKQDTGKTYLSALLLSQQAERLVKGTFSSDLKQVASDIPTETEEYRLEIRRADANQAIMVAVAKQPGFASYTGVVYAVEGKIPVTAMCKTNVPSQMPPQAPLLSANASVLLCPPGSSTVH